MSDDTVIYYRNQNNGSSVSDSGGVYLYDASTNSITFHSFIAHNTFTFEITSAQIENDSKMIITWHMLGSDKDYSTTMYKVR